MIVIGVGVHKQSLTDFLPTLYAYSPDELLPLCKRRIEGALATIAALTARLGAAVDV